MYTYNKMKEVISSHNLPSHTNHLANASNNSETNTNNLQNGTNASKRYAIFSSDWISAIGEDIGLQSLPDVLVRKLSEDASYRLREVLHKCVTRLRHSKKRRLTTNDVNSVITNLCDIEPVMGIPNQMPEYFSEANVFVPHENIVNLVQHVKDPPSFVQRSAPFLQEMEIVDQKLLEVRNSYAKRALKMLFNGSQKTFQVLLNDCATNECLGGEGVIDKLISISRSMVISSNAQYTRVSTRTCQLIIAITNNSKAVYPYHLNSVDKLTELLLEILLGQGFVNQNLEFLFKDCALKLMLRWPSAANKFIPMLKSVLLRTEQNFDLKKREIALELLAGIQPLVFLEEEDNSPLSLANIFQYANPGSNIWHKIALAVCAFVKSTKQPLNYSVILHNFGDSILPYINSNIKEKTEKSETKTINLPIIVRSKIRCASIRQNTNRKCFGDRQQFFPDSKLKGPRKEIRFAFAGSRPVPSNNLRRVSLRANYQVLRNELRAPYALVASRRLLIFKGKKKCLSGSYNLSEIVI